MSISFPHDKTCVICGDSLSVHERAVGEVCGNDRCQHEHLKERLERDRVAIVRLQRLSRAVLRKHAGEAGIDDPNDLPIALIPANRRPVVNLPEKRRRLFRDHVLRNLSAAATERFSGSKTPVSDMEDEPGTSEPFDEGALAVLGECCATCRGDCCERGGDHAFIQVETLVRYMARHPERRPWQVLDDYLSHIGNKTFRGACVYQGAGGCTLPRAMRSDVCNSYYCNGLAAFGREISRAGTTIGFAVASDEGKIVRAAFVDESESRAVDPAAR